MELKNLNIYQRLRDFSVPNTVLDSIFSNVNEIATLQKAWEELGKLGHSNDEIAQLIARTIIEELDDDLV